MKRLLPIALAASLLTACSGAKSKSDVEAPIPDINSPAAQSEMCVEEHLGVLRFSRAYLAEFCPSIKTQLELICFRFVHPTKEWRKACVGIDTADKLECISTVQNGPSYALLESLEKCRTVKNRKQVFCLSRLIAKTGIPLQPETVQECLDKNAN